MASFSPDSSLQIARPNFVEPLQEKYKCPHCHQVLLRPQQTLCGHHVCEICLAQLFAESNGESIRCPVGDEDCEELTRSTDSVVPDHRFRKEIQNLEIFCINKENGCPYQGKWASALKNHLPTCQYTLVDCKYAKEGCVKKLLQQDYDQHIKSDCLYIPVACDYCKKPIASAKMNEHHEKVCEEIEVACPNKCGKMLKRIELASHSIICEKRPQKCQYLSLGCNYEGSKEELVEHEVNDTAKHLKLCLVHIQGASQGASAQSIPPDIMIVVNKKLTDLQRGYQSLKFQVDQIQVQTQTTSKTHQGLIQAQNVSTKLINELTSANDDLSTRIGLLETTQRGIDDGQVGRLSDKLEQLELNVAELGEKVKELEDVCYDGILLWQISDYYKAKQDAISGTQTSLTSPSFYSSRRGYRMCARVYINGDGQGHKTHLSMFFVVMKGKYDAILKWPFQQRVTLQLLDQTGRSHLQDSFKPDVSSSSFQRPNNRDMNVASGCPLFAAHTMIEKQDSGYIGKDKSIFIRVIVEPTTDSDVK